MIVNNQISRRCFIEQRTEIEKAVDELINRVEMMGTHEKLTDAVIFLQDAFNALADWEDMGKPGASLCVK